MFGVGERSKEIVKQAEMTIETEERTNEISTKRAGEREKHTPWTSPTA